MFKARGELVPKLEIKKIFEGRFSKISMEFEGLPLRASKSIVMHLLAVKDKITDDQDIESIVEEVLISECFGLQTLLSAPFEE